MTTTTAQAVQKRLKKIRDNGYGITDIPALLDLVEALLAGSVEAADTALRRFAGEES